jgi:hypothetical protein
VVRRISTIILLALWAATFALASSSVAMAFERSVEGSFEVSIQGVPTRRIEFNAQIGSNGAITGQMSLRDVAVGAAADSEAGAPEPFYLTARVDCLVIKDNNTFLTGTVTEASQERYLGGRLVMVAVDNVDVRNSPSADNLTWGFFRSLNRDWLAKDSERADDEPSPGAWIASDSERSDDEQKVISAEKATLGCDSMPASTLSITDENHATGSVKVRTGY